MELAGSPEKEKDGGRSYLLRAIIAQVRDSRRQDLLRAKIVKLSSDWESLVQQAIPTEEDDNDIRQRDLVEISDDIIALLDRNKDNEEIVTGLAREIMTLLNVNYTKLDPISAKVFKGPVAIRSYCEQQIIRWQEVLMMDFRPDYLPLLDAAKKLRFIGYLSQVVSIPQLVAWISSNLVGTNDPREASENRRYVATWISNSIRQAGDLLPRNQHRQMAIGNQSVGDLLELFSDMHGYTTYNQMPHYVAQVEPFFDLLGALQGINSGILRSPQVGDSEFSALVDQVSKF